MGRIGNRQKGKLAIVGPSEQFFPDYKAAEMNSWIIDQLTLKTARVEIWLAEKSPFLDDLLKIDLIESY